MAVVMRQQVAVPLIIRILGNLECLHEGPGWQSLLRKCPCPHAQNHALFFAISAGVATVVSLIVWIILGAT